MVKKCLVSVSVTLLAVVAISLFALSPSHIEQLANHFLGQDISIRIGEKNTLSTKGAELHSFTLNLNQPVACPLVQLENVQAHWWDKRALQAEKAILDYACFQQIPSAEDATKTEFNLTALLASLPDVSVEIADLQVINAEAISSPALQQLLQSQLSAALSYQDQQLHLQATGKTPERELIQLNATLAEQQVSGHLTYQPQADQQHQADFQFALSQNILDIPEQGKFNLHWQRPDLALTQADLSLQWQDRQGTLVLQDVEHQQPILNVPFKVEKDRFQIEKSQFYWDISALEQPLQGVLNLTLRKPEEDWFPINMDVRLSLFSSGEAGKGNIVIYGTQGTINKDSLNLPLEAHGNVKYGQSIAYVDTAFDVRGNQEDMIALFKEKSTLRVNWKEPNANMTVRIPMTDVIIGKYGVGGRLQAFLQGHTAQFSDIDLHLDGQANQFVAGITSLFALRTDDFQRNGVILKSSDSNWWKWNFNGKANVKALKSPITVSGKGAWQSDHVEIQQLQAHLGKFYTSGIRVPKVEMRLKDTLHWYYEEDKLQGLLQASIPDIGLDYGGHFVKPVLELGIDGKALKDFNLAGNMTAGGLGPIKLFAHYRHDELVGRIYWLEQSAKVFQTLFPQNWEWEILNGTIKGQTDFDVSTERGLQMGGHFSIRQAEVAFPDGELRGIEFALPYRYLNSRIELVKNPVQVSVNYLKSGVLVAENLRVKVQGYYPYSAQRPLTLSELKFNLLGGEMSVNKFALPQQTIANVQLYNIDLSQALTMAEYTQVGLSGRVNATLPFWLENEHCIICDGEITKTDEQDVNLTLGPELITGLKSGGLTEGILADVVSNMNLQKLTANVNLTPNGMLTLASHIQGYNPTKRNKHPITLNYNHQENVHELWDMINYGSTFEQNLEYQLYQKRK
ncbi:YdbH family protein [Lonepinella sp. BR2474]|uniref:YdbH family protein n=1 Tax=Lonepinella sp. BR2474 TaxID=3434548 RepID=UPI003F6DF3C2